MVSDKTIQKAFFLLHILHERFYFIFTIYQNYNLAISATFKHIPTSSQLLETNSIMWDISLLFFAGVGPQKVNENTQKCQSSLSSWSGNELAVHPTCCVYLSWVRIVWMWECRVCILYLFLACDKHLCTWKKRLLYHFLKLYRGQPEFEWGREQKGPPPNVHHLKETFRQFLGFFSYTGYKV